jgi:dTDP-4-dehydrorhamnose 3,5-epimerase
MIFTETLLTGVFVLDLEPVHDARGFFARTWSEEELARHGLETKVAQCSSSFNAKRGTLRGMHYQGAPHEEAKVVRCVRGKVLDVVLDLRPGSRTRAKWVGVELSDDNRRAIYVPPGCAHGFLTLTDGAELFYQISSPYVAEAARGIRWNDPAFAIYWPLSEAGVGAPLLSERDATFPDYG